MSERKNPVLAAIERARELRNAPVENLVEEVEDSENEPDDIPETYQGSHETLAGPPPPPPSERVVIEPRPLARRHDAMAEARALIEEALNGRASYVPEWAAEPVHAEHKAWCERARKWLGRKETI